LTALGSTNVQTIPAGVKAEGFKQLSDSSDVFMFNNSEKSTLVL